MAGNRPRSGRRTSASSAPFHAVLDQLDRRSAGPNSPVSHAPVAPAGGWAYPSIDDTPIASATATAEMYVDADAEGTAPQSPPRSLEEAVARALRLSDDLTPAELERTRRAFAYRHHPDRVGLAHKPQALQRMTIANALIDEAIKKARARAGSSASPRG